MAITRETLAMVEAWVDMIDTIGARPGMYVGRPMYALVRSFIEGFGYARADGVLDDFQAWLSGQEQHRAILNYAWPALLLHEVFPDRDRPAVVAWDPDDPKNEGWPRPPAEPLSEDALSYPDEDAVAIDHLFNRLREYLSSRA